MLRAEGRPYLSLNRFLRREYGCRVQKIPLDAGLTCPNRDGTVGTGGCIYCNSRGSGTGAFARGLGIAEQMKLGMDWALRRYKAKRFIAYFQSFSNTHAPPERLWQLYRQALIGPEVVGLFIGTRPDCVNRDLLHGLREIARGRMLWMEYGLQSASDETLRRINRGHTVQDFIDAVEMTRALGIPVCAHVIFGLPGEGTDEMRATVKLLRKQGVEGVKFHQLYVVRGTPMEDLLRRGAYSPISQQAYARMVAWAISELGPRVVIHRLTGDPAAGELVAPDWSREKARTTAMILDQLKAGARPRTPGGKGPPTGRIP